MRGRPEPQGGERYTFTDLSGDPELRVIAFGTADDFPHVVIEIDFDDDWTARHSAKRLKGVWTQSGSPEFVPAGRSYQH